MYFSKIIKFFCFNEFLKVQFISLSKNKQNIYSFFCSIFNRLTLITPQTQFDDFFSFFFFIITLSPPPPYRRRRRRRCCRCFFLLDSFFFFLPLQRVTGRVALAYKCLSQSFFSFSRYCCPLFTLLRQNDKGIFISRSFSEFIPIK
jgi:hypothetical protein